MTKAPKDTATIPVVAKMSKTDPDTRVAHGEDEVRTVGPSPAVLSDEEKAFLDAMVEMVAERQLHLPSDDNYIAPSLEA